MEPKYKPDMDHYSRWYVSGTNLPGFYGSTVASWSRLESEDQAKVASELCNLAYAAGYKQAQEDMRTALGLNIN